MQCSAVQCRAEFESHTYLCSTTTLLLLLLLLLQLRCHSDQGAAEHLPFFFLRPSGELVCFLVSVSWFLLRLCTCAETIRVQDTKGKARWKDVSDWLQDRIVRSWGMYVCIYVCRDSGHWVFAAIDFNCSVYVWVCRLRRMRIRIIRIMKKNGEPVFPFSLRVRQRHWKSLFVCIFYVYLTVDRRTSSTAYVLHTVPT